jgi:hypothetical protein
MSLKPSYFLNRKKNFKGVIFVLSFLIALEPSNPVLADIALYIPNDGLLMSEQNYDPNASSASQNDPLDDNQEEMSSIDFISNASPLFSESDPMDTNTDASPLETPTDEFYNDDEVIEDPYYETDYYDGEVIEDPYYETDYYDGEADPSVDIEAPIIQFISPFDSSLIFEDVTFNLQLSDNQMLTNIDIFIDDINIKTLSLSGASEYVSFNFDTTTIQNGLHTVKAVAYDGNGNSQVETIQIEIDNMISDLEEPGIIIHSPAPNQTISGNMTLNADLSDNQGLREVSILFQGQTIYFGSFYGETEKIFQPF